MSCMESEGAGYDPDRMRGDSPQGSEAIARRRTASENDFASRMDRSITADFAGAKHPPLAVLNGDPGKAVKAVMPIQARRDQELALDAGGSSDPDQDALEYSWFVSRKPGSYPRQVAIEDGTKPRATVPIPDDAGGSDIHVVLQVRDPGSPDLHACRRAIIGAG